MSDKKPDVRVPFGVNVNDPVQVLRATSMPRGAQREMVKTFETFKRNLREMINNGCRIEILSNGRYQFILPPRLNRLVWEVGIKERAELEKQRGSKSPMRDAMEAMSQELTDAAKKVLDAEKELLAAQMSAISERRKAETPHTLESALTQVAEKAVAAAVAAKEGSTDGSDSN